jgi:putative lipoprotein (rSAM/lipoprotein system)
MKNLFIHFSGKNILKKIILLAGAIMGFSTSVVAQYGAPEAHYRITGFIKSKDCNVPIPKIKVRFSENEQSDYYSYPVYTDSTGKFELDFYEYYGINVDKKNLKIIAEDEDGQQNYGNFLALEKWFILNRKPGGSRYDAEFENIDIVLDYKGKSPCKIELPIDTIPLSNPSRQINSLPADSFKLNTDLKDTLACRPNESNDTLKNIGRGEPPVAPNQDLLIIYPNPSKGHYNIKITLEKPDLVSLEVFDSNSKLILFETWGTIEGMIEKSINLEFNAPGIYYLILKTGNNFYTKELIKQQ